MLASIESSMFGQGLPDIQGQDMTEVAGKKMLLVHLLWDKHVVVRLAKAPEIGPQQIGVREP